MGSLSSSAFSFSAPAVASAEQGAAPRASYDLLIAGGRVIDPGQNLSAVRDVAILHGRVARIAENIPHTQARSVFDATDKIVTPGLIDLHSHVYEHGTPLGVNSDRVGIEAGVTTIVDCGTAGAAMFPGSRYARVVLDRCNHNKREACRVLGISYHTLQAYLTYKGPKSRQ